MLNQNRILLHAFVLSDDFVVLNDLFQINLKNTIRVSKRFILIRTDVLLGANLGLLILFAYGNEQVSHYSGKRVKKSQTLNLVCRCNIFPDSIAMLGTLGHNEDGPHSLCGHHHRSHVNLLMGSTLNEHGDSTLH